MATATRKKNKRRATSPARRRSDARSMKQGPPQRPTTKRGDNKPKANAAQIKNIVAEIRKLQNDESASRLHIIEARIAIGAELNKLKAAVKFGGWEKQRDKVGYDERAAQRLMKLASENFGDKIRGARPDLQQRLPIDIVKLSVLNKLTAEQLQTCLKEHNFESMKRSEVRDVVRAIVPKDASKAKRKPGNSASKTKPDASTKNTPAARLGELRKFCRLAVHFRADVAQRIEKNDVRKRDAVQTVKQIDKAIEALRNMKQSLAAVAK